MPSIVSVSAVKSVRPEVENEPGSQGSSLEGLREAGKNLYWLGRDQKTEAIPASQTATAAVPQLH